jgi:general secretion pathway protein H
MGSSRNRRRHAGFTLLELMVVVLIMGLGLGLVALAIGGDSKSAAREEAEQFMLQSDFVVEQAVFNNEIIGLFMEPRETGVGTDFTWCYRWQRLRANQWQSFEALAERCLPETLQVDMVVENEPYEYDPELDIQPPIVVFYPSGEATPFEIAIYEADIFNGSDPDAVQRIRIDMMGQISWLNREAEIAASRAAK